jgi:putative peptide zinc metalloprotease protein
VAYALTSFVPVSSVHSSKCREAPETSSPQPKGATTLTAAKLEAAPLGSSAVSGCALDFDIASSTDPHRAAPACAVELIGSFQGSGRANETYLARRDDGQWVELSPLLWLTLSNLNGVRTSAQVADGVAAAWSQPVASEDIDYLIDKKLVPAGLVGTPSGKLQRPDLVLALRAKKVLLPAKVVSAISRPLRFLFWGPIVLLVTGLFLGVETYAFMSGRLLAGVHQAVDRPASLLLLGALILGSIFVHEMGHASGCRYGGATPGALGVGVYVSTPAFFTDLSDGYRLGRWGRVRGDLGGVYFNAVYAVAVFPFYLITGSPVLLLVITAMILEIIEQMLPFVRSDGYWVISDLAGVPDLFSYLGSAIRRGQRSGAQVTGLTPSSRRLVMIWGLITLIVLPIAMLFALLALPALAVASGTAVLDDVRLLSHSGETATVAAALLGIAFTCILMGAMIFGVIYITSRLVRLATNSTSGSTDGGAKAWHIRRLVRTSLVVGALALPVAWSAMHVHIH